MLDSLQGLFLRGAHTTLDAIYPRVLFVIFDFTVELDYAHFIFEFVFQNPVIQNAVSSKSRSTLCRCLETTIGRSLS